MNASLREHVIKNFEKYSQDIPEHIRDGFRLYLVHGIEPGSFCRACLENDMKEAAGKADHINRSRIPDIAMFMVWGMPSDSQGSPEKVSAWIKHRGLEGVDDV